MAVIDLSVIICGTPAGVLYQDAAGLMSFRYDEAYDGIPLSLSMPVSNRIYRQDVVKPYLFGLLPDDERQRRAIALEYGISANNPVALLDRIGLDCPGGVQFCRKEMLEGALARQGAYRPLSEREIEAKLAAIRKDANATWMGAEESWSLGGNQGKFALAWHDKTWCECLGSCPTTHIFKNGVAGYRLEALNEYVCMKCAQACDIATAQVDYRLFGDEPALIVTRYDRMADSEGNVHRLHQEDLCQALSIMPTMKYTSDGGPTARDVLDLLSGTSYASQNLSLFTRMLFFNCLIGAPDAHAKNYSLLLSRAGDALIAPLYDVASGLPYEQTRRRARLAMAIGGENRVGRVGAGAIRRYAQGFETAGLTEEACRDTMRGLAERIPDTLAGVLNGSNELPGIGELRAHLLDPVAENCAATLALLQ